MHAALFSRMRQEVKSSILCVQLDQNENAMSSLDYAPLDEINEDYDDHEIDDDDTTA